MKTIDLAHALKRARTLALTPGQRVGNADAAIAIADALMPSQGFDRAAFLEACGVYAYTGEAANANRRNVEVCALPNGTLAIVTGLPR